MARNLKMGLSDDIMNSIDQVYYINLDYRNDRRLQFEDWLSESGFPEEKCSRISAIYTPGRGHVGATLSHIKTLETFLASPHKLCCIFEDDYQPVDSQSFWKSIQTVFDTNIPFDVLLLSYNVLESADTEWPFLKRVRRTFTASGYVIGREFAAILLQNMREAYQLCMQYEENFKTKANEYCLDVYWMKLMPDYKWYCIYPRIGVQRASYSDIEHVYANYNA